MSHDPTHLTTGDHDNHWTRDDALELIRKFTRRAPRSTVLVKVRCGPELLPRFRQALPAAPVCAGGVDLCAIQIETTTELSFAAYEMVFADGSSELVFPGGLVLRRSANEQKGGER